MDAQGDEVEPASPGAIPEPSWLSALCGLTRRPGDRSLHAFAHHSWLWKFLATMPDAGKADFAHIGEGLTPGACASGDAEKSWPASAHAAIACSMTK
ncbi:MAG: hypothetical protein JSR91_10145 [Proteobacteria bacterium]|nr:hypothetical protein [Pseudomonadota bacterium]